MKKAGILKKIVILVLVLVVPGFLYYLLTAGGTNRYKPLPIFGPKQLAKTTHRVKGKDNVNLLASYYVKSKMVCFVSITVDPQQDTAPVLKNYAKSFKPPSPNWLFLTGDTSTIYNLARNGFLVNALQTGKDDFIYSDKLILVDQDKRIRGYYTGASTVDVNRLDDEIKVLVKEELSKKDKPLY